MNSHRSCVWASSVGVIVLTILLNVSAQEKENVRIAILEKHGNGSGTLSMFHTVNSSRNILAWGLSVESDRLSLGTHAPSGLICWYAELRVDAFLEIQCYHHVTRNLSLTPLPRMIPRSIVQSSSQNLRLEDQNMNIDMDVNGDTVFWRDPIELIQIWATSIRSKSSKVIAILSDSALTLGRSGHFRVDSYNGYFIGESIIYNDIRAVQLSKTATQEQAIKLPKAGRSGRWITGVGIDPVQKRFYWTCSSREIESVSYEKQTRGDYSAIRKKNSWKDVNYSFEKTYLSYFSHHLYWLVLNGSVYSMDLDSKTPKHLMTVRGGSTGICVYETHLLDEAPDPCIQLACSHLCLPDYASRRRCGCPPGLTLVNGTTCLPPAIVTWPGKIAAFYLHYRETLSSEKYKECIIHSEQISLSKDDVAVTRKCGDEETRSALRKFPLIKTDVVVDPYGMGHFLTGSAQKCIQANTWETGITSSILCVNTGFINAFAFDFDRSLVFWFHSQNGVGYDSFLRVRKLGSNTNKYSWPASTARKDLAVDAFREKLYFITSTKSLTSANYDGSLQTVLTGTENYFRLSSVRFYLKFFQGHLLWFLRKDKTLNFNSSGIAMYQLDTDTLQMMIPDPSNNMVTFHIIPPRAASHPCFHANCTHTCVPHSTNQFACACPGPLIADKNACKGVHLLVGNVKNNEVEDVNVTQLSKLFIPNENLTTSSWNLSIKNSLEDIIVTSRRGHSQICWTAPPQDYVHCADHEKNTTLILSSLNPNSTILAFNFTGNALYYNDGHAGNITLAPLNQNYVYNFPTFPANEISHWVLDSWRNIFFWVDATQNEGEIHFKVLHDSSLDVGKLRFSDGASISGMTIDMFEKNMFFVQEGVIKRISYKYLFARSDESIVVYPKPNFYDKITHMIHYDQYLFWITTYKPESQDRIMFTNTFTLETDKVIRVSGGYGLKGLWILDPDERYKEQEQHPCQNSGCSHFCFLASPLQDFSFTYDCYCPEGLTLIDGRRCELVEDPLPDDNSMFVIASSIGGIVALCTVVGLTIALVLKSRKNALLADMIDQIKHGNSRAARAAKNSADRAQHLPLTCIIPPAELSVDETKVLGQGAFGLVLQGVYRNTIVAVKTLKPSYNLNQLADFSKEVKIMHYIGSHPHIIRFFGAEISNIRNRTFYAVLEFSPGGSLLKHLRKMSPHSLQAPETLDEDANNIELTYVQAIHRIHPNRQTPACIHLEMMISWAEQIARGMDYLTKMCVTHGDLAARNILVFDNGIIKISDFGLSRQLYQYAHYKKKNGGLLPWRWMAVECLQDREFSPKSDVWSYGITLWEIFTFGEMPYPERQWNKDFLDSILRGSMLNKPDVMTQDFYDTVLMPCWKIQPDQRPTFADLLHIIQGFIASTALPVEYEMF